MMNFFRFAFLFCLMTGVSLAESGSVKKLSGEIHLNGVPLKMGDPVNEGQKIEAKGSKSYVVIQFDGGGRVFLRDGEMILEASKNKQDSIISVTRGTFASHFTKTGKSSQTVKTKYATMGVRGTKYYVEQKDESTYLCVCEGEVEIQNEKSKQLVGKNEDAKVYADKSFEKTKANQMMIEMALDAVKALE